VVRRLYGEVVDAFNANIPTLCAAGVRSLVEAICVDRKVTGGDVPDAKEPSKTSRRTTLEGKLFGMVTAGHLTKDHMTALQEQRYLGNEAVHDEFAAPALDSLSAAIDIIEHTLEHIYELNGKVARVRPKKEKT